jgi:hypothetical protein
MLTLPKSAMTFSMAALTLASSVTFTAVAVALRPMPSTSATMSSMMSVFMSQPAMSAP